MTARAFESVNEHEKKATSALPAVTTVQAKYKDCHGFIGRSRLFLGTGRLDGFASATGKETCFEQVALDATHFINLVFIGLVPI